MATARVRLGALALAVAGVLFVLYPAIRPYSDETSLQGAVAFASSAWIVAHVLAMLGFVLVALGLLALYRTLRDTPAEGLAFLALVATWIGAGLTLPYYGAEAFGLHVLGQEAVRQQSAAMLTLANDVRYGPGIYLFGADCCSWASARSWPRQPSGDRGRCRGGAGSCSGWRSRSTSRSSSPARRFAWPMDCW